jgi:4-amino-4-deoxy-L-arabinose transferase-like glycosyltransferase
MTDAGRRHPARTRTEALFVHLGDALERLEIPTGGARICVAMGAVILIAGALFLFRVGAAEVCNSNEAVEGLVVQQMIEHGELLFPMLNGDEPTFKPPLFHWTATAIARVLGASRVTELTLRMPSVLFGLACLLLTMVFVQRWLGLPSAVLAGLVLLASFQFVSEARFGRVDMALTFCESLAIFAFLSWLRDRGHRDGSPPRHAQYAAPMLYVFALGLGLGVLAKGPVGMLLPLASALLLLLLERRWTDLRALGAPGPMAVLILIGSWWYLSCLVGHRLDLLHRQIVAENVSRFFGGIRTMSAFYYVKPLLLNSGPISMLVPVAVFAALRASPSRRTHPDGSVTRDEPAYALAIFWVLTVVFFSVAAYKRRAYLLPLWPSAAALLAWWLGTLTNQRVRQLGTGAVAALCAGLIVMNLTYIPHVERKGCGSARYRQAASAINEVVPRSEPLYVDDRSTQSTALLFYLDRNVPLLGGTLADAPRGYVLVPERTWATQQPSTLRPLLSVTLGRGRWILLQSRRESS